jgi:hypothetical protein
MGPNADAALEQLLDLERRFVWQTAERAASREAYENFLLQYPDALEADEARQRIAALSPPVPARAVKPTVAKPATAKAPATTARTPTIRPGNTRLQFGAFSTRERALQQRQSLESRFGKLLPGALSVDAPGSNSRDQLYRLRSTPMSEAQARSTCTALKEQGQACMVVP